MSTPGEDALVSLHKALLAGDRIASARLAEVLVPTLRQRLQGFAKSAGADPHTLDAAIDWSIVKYLNEAERYDPTRGLSLVAYLAMDVRGDVMNELQSRHTREQRQEPETEQSPVELSPNQRNRVEEALIERLDPLGVPSEKVARVRQQLLEAFDSRDRELILMMADGVRSTAAFAEVLNISHLPARQQQTEVKRHKDRLTKQLERLRERLR